VSDERSADAVDRAGDPTASRGWTGDLGWATLDRPVGAVVLLAVLFTLWRLGGLAGVLTWLVIAGCWLLFPPVVSVAVGQFVLVALTPADTGLVTLLPAESALLALLAASFLDSGAWLPGSYPVLVSTRQNLADALAYVGAAIALSALVLYAGQLFGPLLAGGLCLAVVAVVAYGLRPVVTE